MRKALIAILLLSLMGCTASTINISKDGKLTATEYNVSETYSNGQLLSRTLMPFKRFDFNVTDIMAGIPGIINALPKPIKQDCPQCPQCPEVKPCPDPVTPTPNPTPEPTPTPTPSGDLTVIDMDTQPGEIRQLLGISAGDSSIWYAANCHELSPGWESWSPEGADGEALRGTGDRLRAWLTAKVDSVVAALKADSSKTVTVIKNDGPDKCGSRVGPPIAQRIKDAGIAPGRISLGEIYYP